MNLLSARIATRYIFSKKSHSAINLISAVAVCGIIVTTAAMVCVLSVFNGFSSLIESKLSAIDPDIKIQSVAGKHINDIDSLIGILGNMPEIAYALPVIEEHALAAYGERQTPVSIKGVPDAYKHTCGIESTVKDDGRYVLRDTMGNYAVVSVGTAVSLQAHPGYHTPLLLFAPKRVGKVNMAMPAQSFVADTLFISGVFQIDQLDYDASTILVPLQVAEKLFGYANQATAIEITLAHGVDAHKAIAQIYAKLGDGFTVKDRLMQQQASFRMVNIEKWVSFLLLGFILIIASFNVISSLAVLIVEKKQAMTSLANIGASRSFIIRVFMWQTMIIGAMGIAAGAVIGIVACALQEHFGLIKFSGDTGAMIVDAYPVVLIWTDVVAVATASLFVSFLASLAIAAIAHARTRSLFRS